VNKIHDKTLSNLIGTPSSDASSDDTAIIMLQISIAGGLNEVSKQASNQGVLGSMKKSIHPQMSWGLRWVGIRSRSGNINSSLLSG
jgi:hypothetical protein